MSFLNIRPRTEYGGLYVPYIPLRVIQGDGFEFNPDFNVNITDLNSGHKHFKVDKNRGDSFKINVIIKETDKVFLGKTIKQLTKKSFLENKSPLAMLSKDISRNTSDFARKNVSVSVLLNYIMFNGITCYIHTDAIGLKENKDLWLITGNPSRKQTHKGSTIWDLTFTKFNKISYAVFKTDNKAVKQALAKKTNTKKSKVKSKTTTRQKFSKCKLSQVKYSKSKKVTNCTKYLQAILCSHGFMKKSEIDGWYGKDTLNAVKRFQKKFSKKYKLKVNGVVDKNTFNALIHAPVASVNTSGLNKTLAVMSKNIQAKK